jgi:hypothetical protein
MTACKSTTFHAFRIAGRDVGGATPPAAGRRRSLRDAHAVHSRFQRSYCGLAIGAGESDAHGSGQVHTTARPPSVVG